MTTTEFSFDDINGKIAVIPGGADVLCGAFARALAGVGAKIALLDINKNAAQKEAEDIAKLSGAQVIGIACDVLSKKSLEAARIQINAEFGSINILVNGAGGNAKSATTEIEQISDMVDAPKSFYGLEIDGFNSVFNLNFIGTLLRSKFYHKICRTKNPALLSTFHRWRRFIRCRKFLLILQQKRLYQTSRNGWLYIWHQWAFGSTPWHQGSL